MSVIARLNGRIPTGPALKVLLAVLVLAAAWKSPHEVGGAVTAAAASSLFDRPRTGL